MKCLRPACGGEGLPPSAKRLEHFCENMTVAGSTDSDPAGNEGPPAPAVPSAVDEMDGELNPLPNQPILCLATLMLTARS